MALLLSAAVLPAHSAPQDERWACRVIPLPKEISVKGSLGIREQAVYIDCQTPDSPAVTTATELLRTFCRGEKGDRKFAIRLMLTSGAEKTVRKVVCDRLRHLPNADQAYIIRPLPRRTGLALVANTPRGLLYAVRTLVQLVDRSGRSTPDAKIEIPLAEVTDWPDLAERGQWGGNTASDLRWTSQWKLNVLEQSAAVSMDKSGNPTVGISRKQIDQGTALGVKVVPFILHLEQVIGVSGISDGSEIAGKPDPSKPLPSDYKPGLCMSSPATRELVSSWFEQIARIGGVTDVMVWLSEGRTPCFCDKCAGKEPYELEVKCIVNAFRTVQTKHPELRLRLLLTQGSYPVNDKILAMVPPDVGVTYYDGGRTYDSSRKPMIYPLLEDYAKSGRWLGVYPQITHSWRTVFPWTAPQFLRFRCREFVDKHLSCMIGYAVPSNRYHEFNVMAMAEWTWNAHGRSAEDFCRAYALKTHICDPDLFAKWALLAGDAGWSVAESRLMLTAIYTPGLGLGSGVPFDHRFGNTGIVKSQKLKETVAAAKEALKLARRSANADMISESECLLGGLEAFDAIRSASESLREGSLDDAHRKSLAESLDRLDGSSRSLRNAVLEWGIRVGKRAGEKALPGRLLDTAFALLQTSDAFRSGALELGVSDPHPECRMRRLRDWSAKDFPNGPHAMIRLDITDKVPQDGGSYQLGFHFTDSAYGTGIKGARLLQTVGSSEKRIAQASDLPIRISRWETCHEARIDIPARPSNSRIFLEIDLSGLPSDAPTDRRTCSGWIGVRELGDG